MDPHACVFIGNGCYKVRMAIASKGKGKRGGAGVITYACALTMAIPISWFVMKGWLQNFAYRIDLAWWIFVLACLITVLISMLTIAIQTVNGHRNPTESLRTE